MSQRRGNGRPVSNVNYRSANPPQPKTRWITADDEITIYRGTQVNMHNLGISATGPGRLYLDPFPGARPPVGTYETTVQADGDGGLWLGAWKELTLHVALQPRTLTGTLGGGEWCVGDEIGLPPPGLLLSGGPSNFRVIAPPGGVFQEVGDAVTVTIEAAANADWTAARWSGTVEVDWPPGSEQRPFDSDDLDSSIKPTMGIGDLSTEEIAGAFFGKSPEQVKNELESLGIPNITVTVQPGKSSKATMLYVDDQRSRQQKGGDRQQLTAVEFHEGGGVHGKAPYVRISTTQGKIKIVDPSYDAKDEQNIEYIFVKGS